jgi:hypothetical protein
LTSSTVVLSGMKWTTRTASNASRLPLLQSSPRLPWMTLLGSLSWCCRGTATSPTFSGGCQRHGGCSPQHMWRPLHLPAGPEAIFLGEGDLHDTSYDYMEVDTGSLRSCNITLRHQALQYDIRIYPSQDDGRLHTSTSSSSTLLSLCLSSLPAMVFSLRLRTEAS